MAGALRVLLFALLQFSASVLTSASSDCTTGACSAQNNDDAFAMLQTKTKEVATLQSKSPGLLLQVGGAERLAAAQKMESSRESAVMKMISGTGPTLPPEIFESIFTEMELIRKELIGEKDGFQAEIDDANEAVAKCNENMQDTSNGEIAAARTNSDASKNTHNTCRLAESSAYDAKSNSCDELASRTDTISGAAPQCNCALSDTDTSAVLSCLASNRNWVESNENNLKLQKSDCDSKTGTWSSKAAECDADQSSYELAFCSYAANVEDMCLALDTCYSDKIASRTSIVGTVQDEEKHIKAVLASAKKIVCFLSILNKSSTENLTMSDFEACKDMNVSSDKTYLSTSVPDLDITYPLADAKDTCQTVSPLPGDGQWAAAEYANYTQEWLRATDVCSHKITTTIAEVPVFVDGTGNSCPVGSVRIEDQSTCQEVAASRGYSFDPRCSDNYDGWCHQRPTGCWWDYCVDCHGSGQNIYRAFFNNEQDNVAHTGITPVCKEA
jgi:hypothetical protein